MDVEPNWLYSSLLTKRDQNFELVAGAFDIHTGRNEARRWDSSGTQRYSKWNACFAPQSLI
jgi:hypothetical protein